jgi:hypothetical protein
MIVGGNWDAIKVNSWRRSKSDLKFERRIAILLVVESVYLLHLIGSLLDFLDIFRPKMVAIWSMLFCDACGNLLPRSNGPQGAQVPCDDCGTSTEGETIVSNGISLRPLR